MEPKSSITSDVAKESLDAHNTTFDVCTQNLAAFQKFKNSFDVCRQNLAALQKFIQIDSEFIILALNYLKRYPCYSTK